MRAFAYLCPKCKTPNPQNVQYCVKCGHWLLDSRFPATPISEKEYHRLLRVGYSGQQNFTYDNASWNNSMNKPRKNGCLKVFGWVFGIILSLFIFLVVLGTIINSNPASINSINSSDVAGSTIVSDITENKESSPTTPNADVKIPSIGAQESKLESKDEYIKSCKVIEFSDLCRYPEKYKGTRIQIAGQVTQFLAGSSFSEEAFALYEDYEILSEENSTYLQKKWYIAYTQPSEERILVNDIITFYGVYDGIMSVSTVLGADEQVPRMIAKYHSIENIK